MIEYRDYLITPDYPFVRYEHKDYDGLDGRYGYGISVAHCERQIDSIIDESL